MEDKVTHKHNTFPAPPVSPETVLARLDTIIRELQELRRALLTQTPVAPTGTAPITQRLSGALAPPTQDESFDVWEEYRSMSDHLF